MLHVLHVQNFKNWCMNAQKTFIYLILHSRFSYMPCHELSNEHHYESFGILLGDFGSYKNF